MFLSFQILTKSRPSEHNLIIKFQTLDEVPCKGIRWFFEAQRTDVCAACEAAMSCQSSQSFANSLGLSRSLVKGLPRRPL